MLVSVPVNVSVPIVSFAASNFATFEGVGVGTTNYGYAILGNEGSGKNTFLSRIASLTDKPVWSDFRLDLPNYIELGVMDVFDLEPNILVFIDEAYA